MNTYENICFEGGGVKGFAYIGAIIALEELDMIKNLKRFSGSSVGSFYASLLCAGFSSKQIKEISSNIDLSLPNKCIFSKVYKIWKKFGIYKSNILESEIRKALKIRVDPDITLQELHDITGKDLVIVATNLNKKAPVYFHYKTHPDTTLINAIIASMCIPIVFQPRKLGDYYVDGGVTDNYPIWVFNDLEKLNNGDIHTIDKESKIPSTTLGLKLFTSCKETNTKEVFEGKVSIPNVQSYMSEMLNTFLLQIERADITPSYIHQTIPIYVPDIPFTFFSIDKKMMQKLINLGNESVKKHTFIN